MAPAGAVLSRFDEAVSVVVEMGGFFPSAVLRAAEPRMEKEVIVACFLLLVSCCLLVAGCWLIGMASEEVFSLGELRTGMVGW